jgi:AMP-polyphosphate phosphotransferase
MWRYWRTLPPNGRMAIYSGGWHLNALNEDPRRERELAEHGVIVPKFWLHISKDEQLRRLRDRESTLYKRHKMDAKDWRNRHKWQPYEIAVGDMLALTSSHHASWHLVAANNKRHARLEVIKTSCRQIEAALGLQLRARPKKNRRGSSPRRQIS